MAKERENKVDNASDDGGVIQASEEAGEALQEIGREGETVESLLDGLGEKAGAFVEESAGVRALADAMADLNNETERLIRLLQQLSEAESSLGTDEAVRTTQLGGGSQGANEMLRGFVEKLVGLMTLEQERVREPVFPGDAGPQKQEAIRDDAQPDLDRSATSGGDDHPIPTSRDTATPDQSNEPRGHEPTPSADPVVAPLPQPIVNVGTMINPPGDGRTTFSDRAGVLTP
jgi:hypothetical protein